MNILSTNAPTNTSTNASTNAPTNTSTNKSTNKPTNAPTNAPNNTLTNAPNNTLTNKSTNAPTNAPTNNAPTKILEQKEPKIAIPDQLNITIHTNIPGYQSIDYKLYMTIKDIDEKGVRFNPLIKLNKSLIDTIPEQYKIKQFFNLGLFKSLLNYTNGTIAKDLIQATQYGYVNNNIKATIDTIFPVNSVIYIAKKPFVIGDMQWSTGDWSINVKQKKTEIDPNKITDTKLYNELILKEISIGEEQLSQIPTAILVGDNYNGPPPLIIKPVEPIIEKPPPIIEKPPPIIEKPIDNGTKSLPLAIENGTKSLPLAIENGTKYLPLAIENGTKDLPLKDISKVEEITIEEDNLFDNFKINPKKNSKDTIFFIEYFKNNDYYNIINTVYENSNYSLKQFVNQFYKKITKYEPNKNNEKLSTKFYKASCDQTDILKSVPNGNCFFEAVANGINIYNYENQSTKITNGIYGKIQLFTIYYLRQIVLEYVNNLNLNYYMNKLAPIYVDILNAQFKTIINNEEFNSTQYLDELSNVYKTNYNFLIYKPTQISTNENEYNNPFRVIKNNELEKYILSSDYWANEVAIEAICKKLKICVLTIEETNNSSNNYLKAILNNNSQVKEENCSNKIMFLYYKNNHFELIRFKSKTQKQRENTYYKYKFYTIFNNNEIFPPIHILFLIYGSIYSEINEIDKKNFSIYLKFMEEIHTSVKKILLSSSSDNFLKLFNKYFPTNKTIKAIINNPSNSLIIQSNDQAKNLNEQKGGLYNSPTDFNSNLITKTSSEVGQSKIAYNIKIYMDLYPGKSLTPEELNKSKCNSKYNAIKRAFAEFTGKPYVITPIYNKTIKNNTNDNTLSLNKNPVVNKNSNNKTIKNNTNDNTLSVNKNPVVNKNSNNKNTFGGKKTRKRQY